jgi:hypothetical protein
MRQDDNHEHSVHCKTLEELEDICHCIDFYEAYNRHQNGKEGWEKHYEDILKSIELFGIMNVSLYFDEYQRYGDHLEELLLGFWINLKKRPMMKVVFILKPQNI